MLQQTTAEKYGKWPARHLAELYRDYLNSFFFIDSWAADNSVSADEADEFYAICKACHEAGF